MLSKTAVSFGVLLLFFSKTVSCCAILRPSAFLGQQGTGDKGGIGAGVASLPTDAGLDQRT